MNQPSTSDPSPDLGRIFAYDALDLASNAKGFLSDAQKARLRHQIDDSRLAYLMAFISGVFAIVIGYTSARWTGLLVGIAFLGVFLGIAWLSAQRTQRLLNGAVKRLEGRPVLGDKGDFRDTLTIAHVQFGKTVFRLPPYAAQAFTDKGYYRVYYLPKANIIVAVERI